MVLSFLHVGLGIELRLSSWEQAPLPAKPSSYSVVWFLTAFAFILFFKLPPYMLSTFHRFCIVSREERKGWKG